MWSYYGSKSKIIKKYPPPEHDLIIEPFAGSARYALLYHDKQVLLNDTYKIIIDNWNYLIKATPEQINNFPDFKRGDDLRNFDIPQEEKNLIGFAMARGRPVPSNIYSPWAADGDEIGTFKRRVLKNLDNIRHFKTSCVDYRDLENKEATWFIDPPYQQGGHLYVENSINYEELAEWCKSRKGQVIVCENGNADWLPFRPLVELQGQRRRTLELIWTNQDIPGDDSD